MITISTDPAQLDTAYIHGFLSGTYWAKDRTLEEVETAIAHCLNFGVYLDGKQIGYARVVTDYVGFAYLMDVFTDPRHQGKGVAKQLVQQILDSPELRTIKTWRAGNQ